MKDNILERMVFHAGKILLHAGEKHTDAFIVQKGEIIAYAMENNQRVPFARYTQDCIIAESNLLLDDHSNLTYEAAVDTTVIRITRQDFEKNLTKLDTSILKIVGMLVKKLKDYEEKKIEDTLLAKTVDDKAKQIVEHLLRDMSGDRREKYEEILLPHFNIMVKALDDLRIQERHNKQKEHLDQRLEEIREEAAE